MLISEEFLMEISSALDSIQNVIPTKTKLLCGGQVSVIAFTLINSEENEEGCFFNLRLPLEVDPFITEEPLALKKKIENWMEKSSLFCFLKSYPNYPLQFFKKEVINSRDVFIPNDVVERWKFLRPANERYPFEEVVFK